MRRGNREGGFTLIELLVVIAILVVLATAVILIINPAELLAQGRDALRISDLATLNSTLALFQAEHWQRPMGAASTTYLSIPDMSPTCANTGLTPPSGWTYHCAPTSTYAKVDGTGWIPVDFTLISAGSPLSKLPIDPANTTSSGLYYTYTPGGSYAISSALESQKYLSTASQDQGFDPGRYEIGSDISLIAKSEGLVGWWPFDGDVLDKSGNEINFIKNGSPAWLSGLSCQSGGCVSFTTVDSLSANSPRFNFGTGDFTIMAWVKPTRRTDGWGFDFFGNYAHTGQYGDMDIINTDNSNNVGLSHTPYPSGIPVFCAIDYSQYFDSWHFLAFSKIGNTLYYYVDSSLKTTCNASTFNVQLNPSGAYNYFVNTSWRNGTSVVDDLRVYARGMSSAEVRAMYQAEKIN